MDIGRFHVSDIWFPQLDTYIW